MIDVSINRLKQELYRLNAKELVVPLRVLINKIQR